MNKDTPPKYDCSPKSWAELNRWANYNIGTWSTADEHALQMGMTEVEKLRLLASALLQESSYYKNRVFELAELSPMPIFIKPNQ